MLGILPAVVAFLITFIIATLCVAWAPFAAFICGHMASQKRLSVKRYAIHGAIYSTILFLPWWHLMIQMRGEPISQRKITNAYTVIFVLTGLVLASHISFILVWWYSEGQVINTLLDDIIMSTIGSLTFIAGLISRSRTNSLTNQLNDQQDSHNAIDLPNISYIAPFAWGWVDGRLGAFVACEHSPIRMGVGIYVN